jgi:hypothetical protein
MAPPVLDATITCPHCGHSKQETMQTDACQYFYTCEACQQTLRPKPGDCCCLLLLRRPTLPTETTHDADLN